MSVAKTKARWFRIYSADRHIRKAVGANTLEDLITEGISYYMLITSKQYYQPIG